MPMATTPMPGRRKAASSAMDCCTGAQRDWNLGFMFWAAGCQGPVRAEWELLPGHSTSPGRCHHSANGKTNEKRWTGLMNRALVLVLGGKMNLDRAMSRGHFFFAIQVVQDLVVTFATRAVQASPAQRRSCSSSDISSAPESGRRAKALHLT
jgi:hypothetical protein